MSFLQDFASTRRMARGNGSYFVHGSGPFGQNDDPDVIDSNGTGNRLTPENGTVAEMPGLWCQWVPTTDGSGLTWDQGEKFYNSSEWMDYLLSNFLSPDAFASTPEGKELVKLAGEEERFSKFTFNHVANGVIDAQGEDPEDRWRLVVLGGKVTTQTAQILFGDLKAELTAEMAAERALGNGTPMNLNDAQIRALKSAASNVADDLARAKMMQRGDPTWKSGNGVSIDQMVKDYQDRYDALREGL